MSTDDTLADFESNGHLRICHRNSGEFQVAPGRQMACNRDCAGRLYDLAVRTEALLNPVADAAPECEGHREQQHRDGKPPWCSRCGWFRAKAAVPAQKIGTSSADRTAMSVGHKPWSPGTGYGQPGITLGPTHPGGYKSTGPFNG